MSTELNLISFEQLANIIFLISTFYSIESGNKAAQSVIEKQQGTPPSGPASPGASSAQLAFISTSLSALSYIIFILVSIARKNQLESQTLAGTTTTPIWPIATIAFGFVISLAGAVVRLPAIQERIRESQEVVL